ncbi:MAG TPA: hypothetical protein VH601_22855 [Bryobacteraceae bacterium]
MKLVAAGCVAMLLRAGIVDRLAITVGRESITELQLDEELRVTALLNDQPVSRTTDARRAAADRLVEQLLIKREMDLSHYRGTGPGDLAAYLAQVQSACGGPDRFWRLLRQYDLSESTLKEHLELQLAISRFVEYRFQSDMQPATSSIRPKTIEQQTDEALAAWLEESRKQVNIVYIDKSLQ